MSATAMREQAEAMQSDLPLIELPEGLAALREPFDPSMVGKLPKPYKSDATKGECSECGKWHGLPAMHLDFVGHGAVTARLLDVDPTWTWEPMATTPEGLPALDRHGNLWIRLTVCGVTRIGVGDGANMKVLIGDAIRNAAMRFGVALDLWVRGSEDEKQHDDDGAAAQPAPPSAEPEPEWTARDAQWRLRNAVEDKEATDAKNKETAAAAWQHFDGDKNWRSWEHAFPQADIDAWVNEPADPTEGQS